MSDHITTARKTFNCFIEGATARYIRANIQRRIIPIQKLTNKKMKVMVFIFFAISARILPDTISQLFYPGKDIKLMKRDADDDFRKSLLRNILSSTDSSQDSSLDSLLGDLLTNR